MRFGVMMVLGRSMHKQDFIKFGWHPRKVDLPLKDGRLPFKTGNRNTTGQWKCACRIFFWFFFVFNSILCRPSGEHVQAADMGRVMGTLMSDQIFASVAYSGLVTYPHFSISFLTIVPCSGIGNHIGFGWLSFLLQALWIPERIPNSIQLTVFSCCCCFYDVYR